MKRAKIIGMFMGVCVLMANVLADVITLTDVTTFSATGTISAEDYVSSGRGAVNKLDGFGDYVSWNHLYTFNPPVQDILSAELVLTLRDDDSDNIFNWESALVFQEGTGISLISDVDSDDYNFNVNISSVENGSYNVIVGSILGDFYIDRSELTIQYTSASVPEPATLSLLGAGLLGLAFIRRKK